MNVFNIDIASECRLELIASRAALVDDGLEERMTTDGLGAHGELKQMLATL